jgi:hypothetical protein
MRSVLVLATAFVLSACATTKTFRIQTLLNDPKQYDGKTVRVEGEVVEAAGILGFGAFQVRDETGTLPVVSQGGGAPARGTHVGVEGTFRAAYTLGTSSKAVLVEKKRFTR